MYSPKWKFNWTLAISLTDSQKTRRPDAYCEIFAKKKYFFSKNIHFKEHIGLNFYGKKNIFFCDLYTWHNSASVNSMGFVVQLSLCFFLCYFHFHIKFYTAVDFQSIFHGIFGDFFQSNYEFFMKFSKIQFTASNDSKKREVIIHLWIFVQFGFRLEISLDFRTFAWKIGRFHPNALKQPRTMIFYIKLYILLVCS